MRFSLRVALTLLATPAPAGKLADLAVLSQDILGVPPDAIRDTTALMTVVGGKVVHRSGM